MEQNWIIRTAIGNDLPFIYSTWSKSYRCNSILAKECENETFSSEFNSIMDTILGADDTKIALAVDPRFPEDVIYGYMIAQPDRLHYAFTKKVFRKHGIAKALYEYLGSPTFCTHMTSLGKRALKNKDPQLIYNPFLLYKQEK